MTSFNQIEANRRNALLSTGPRTEDGKMRSRRNAVRHGLTAETIIHVLEDSEEYSAFELSVTSDFDAQTAVERELVLRLASLLWRLRRAISIESGLLGIQAKILRQARQARQICPQPQDHVLDVVQSSDAERRGGRRTDGAPSERLNGRKDSTDTYGAPRKINAEFARCFLRLANLDNGAFERLTRYETALWRQVGQLLMMLEMMRRMR